MPMYAARLRTLSRAVVKKGHFLLIEYEGSADQTSLKFQSFCGGWNKWEALGPASKSFRID